LGGVLFLESGLLFRALILGTDVGEERCAPLELCPARPEKKLVGDREE